MPYKLKFSCKCLTCGKVYSAEEIINTNIETVNTVGILLTKVSIKMINDVCVKKSLKSNL